MSSDKSFCEYKYLYIFLWCIFEAAKCFQQEVALLTAIKLLYSPMMLKHFQGLTLIMDRRIFRIKPLSTIRSIFHGKGSSVLDAYSH